MSQTLQDRVRQLLGTVVDPHNGKNLVDGGVLKGVGVSGDAVSVDLVLGYPARSWHDALAKMVRETLERDPAIARAVVNVSTRIAAHKVQQQLTPLPNIRNVIAVASGKGGVGKSTTAVNFALALVAEGATVGILDADIYGPSVPRMTGVSGRPDTPDGRTIEPKRNHGLQIMSIGLLVEEDTPMIWRGPMVTQALQQLLSETAWQDLDYLVIDLPPGTGDIQLTLCQKVPVAGAIVVTTPQDIALLDAKKGLRMFEKVEVPVLGIVENMAIHVCSNCGHAEHVFGSGGGESMSAQYGVPLLGALPLSKPIREEADGGMPTVVARPDSAEAATYREIARRATAQLALQSRNKRIEFPKIVIENG